MAAPPLEQMWARVEGQNRPALESRVCVVDHGVMYGDSVYETMRTYNGQLFRLQDHLDRLRRSALGVRMELPWTDQELTAELEALCGELTGDLYVRALVLRGVASLDYARNATQKPTLVVLAGPFVPTQSWVYQRGLKAGLVDTKRTPNAALSPNFKTGNLLNARMAHMEARERGWDEALMLNMEGHLTEAASSNLFLVDGGALCTALPSDGILEGVTRKVILELAEGLKLPYRVASLSASVLDTCSEAFLTSTTRPVGPIGELNGRTLAVPGPVTRQLMDAFLTYAGGL